MKLLDWLRARRPEQTSPQQFLAEAQRQHPPVRTHADDLGRRILDRLNPRLSPATRDWFTKGEAVIGEVGILSPNALAEFVPPHGYAIRVNTGLANLFHTVSRILMTASTWRTNAGELGPTATQDEATDLIARLCRGLKQDEPIAAPADFGLPAPKLAFATDLANGAEDFVIAHELGHVAEWIRRGGDPGEILPEEEYAADRHALETVIGAEASWPVQRRMNRRVPYAGAEFALRIFGSLENLDYPFERTHPLPGGRLKKLRETARAVVGSRFRFVEISTLAFSSDQQLEAMERKITGDAKAARFVVGPTADRMLSSLSVFIEWMANGNMSAESAANQFTHLLAGLPAETVQETIAEATAMYEVEALDSAHLRNVQLRLAEMDAFKALKAQLPELFRAVAVAPPPKPSP